MLFYKQIVNRLLFSASADHTVRCWVYEFGECTRVYRGHTHTIGCMKITKGLCKYFKIFPGFWLSITDVFLTKVYQVNRIFRLNMIIFSSSEKNYKYCLPRISLPL